MSLSASIDLKLLISESNGLDLSSVVNNIPYNKVTQLLNGSAAGQATKAFSDKRSIAASGTDDLDLVGGLTDAFGASITFTSIKALIFVASAANQDDIHIGGNANAFDTIFGDAADTLVLKPDGMIMLTAPGDGFAVTADTADVLTATNQDGANASEYDVIIVGVTA